MEIKPIRSHLHQFKKHLEARVGSPGAIAEFGVYNGGSTRQLATFCRPVYAFDTYSGTPEEGYRPELDWTDPPGKFKPRVTIEQMCEGFDNIVPVKGEFKDTCPTFDKDVKFVLVYMDCDHYHSYTYVLNWLIETERLYNNSVIICDDYPFCLGARKAIHEFCGKWGATYESGEEMIVFPPGFASKKSRLTT